MKASSSLLQFEWDNQGQLLEIQADTRGLKYLISQLNNLLEKPGADHVHLMTPSWGGRGLSEETVEERSTLVNHVKIYKWE